MIELRFNVKRVIRVVNEFLAERAVARQQQVGLWPAIVSPGRDRCATRAFIGACLAASGAKRRQLGGGRACDARALAAAAPRRPIVCGGARAALAVGAARDAAADLRHARSAAAASDAANAVVVDEGDDGESGDVERVGAD